MKDKDKNQPTKLSENTKKGILEWSIYLGKALLDAILLKLGFTKV